jgi:phage tail-like protein
MLLPEPTPTIRFMVVIDGHVSLGSWSKCEGLAVEYEVLEYQEGGRNDYVHRLPGRRKYPNIKLTRPLNRDSRAVATWVSGQATKVKRHNAQIALLDPLGTVVCQWSVIEAYPIKWTGPTLDAAGNQIALETLELAHHGFSSWVVAP